MGDKLKRYRIDVYECACCGAGYDEEPDDDGSYCRTEDVQALESERDRLRGALAFAASCIKSGEPWTETCEQEIGALLYKKEGRSDG